MTVAVVAPPPGVPVVTISSNPVSPVALGTAVTLSWRATNDPASCVASGDWTGAKPGIGSETTAALTSAKTYSFKIDCKNSAGEGTFDSADIRVVAVAPVVTVTASPSSVYVGGSSTITWSATNSPASCSASGDWTGAKTASGTQNTGALNTVKLAHFAVTCQNGGGTTTQEATVNVTLPPKPVVSLAASPTSITSGGSSTLTWSATNSPTSCTASGDWTGAKTTSGTQNTGTLSTVKIYSYSLTCTNAGGSNIATTSVDVGSGAPASQPPLITISASPTTIGTGNSSTLSWSVTNSPTSCTASGSWSGGKGSSGTQSTGVLGTAGAYTYTLACSNGAGSDTKSTTVTVIDPPVVTVTVNPTSITTGSSANLSWNATGSPSSCTAGGSWSGTKAASGGPVTTGTMSTAGTYIYSLSCTNAGGTGSGQASLTVSNPAPVYCGGLSPCYGPSTLALHNGPGDCWGWNLTWVVNITSFRPSHLGGIKSGSTSTIENASATCNHDIHTILTGGAGITGYKDASGATTHGHQNATNNNSGSSALSSYRVGYYDSTKP